MRELTGQALRPAGAHPGRRRFRLAQRLERRGGGALRGAARREECDRGDHILLLDLSGIVNRPHIGREAAGAEPPCFISLSLVPTERPELSGRLFLGVGRMQGYSDELLRRILARTRTIACVGISTNEIRPSFYVARYLRLKGFRVIPVNPGFAGEVLLGETSCRTSRTCRTSSGRSRWSTSSAGRIRRARSSTRRSPTCSAAGSARSGCRSASWTPPPRPGPRLPG